MIAACRAISFGASVHHRHLILGDARFVFEQSCVIGGELRLLSSVHGGVEMIADRYLKGVPGEGPSLRFLRRKTQKGRKTGGRPVT